MNWLRPIDFFVHDAIRAQGADALRRARMAVGFAIVSAGPFVWTSVYQGARGFAPTSAIAGGMALALLALPLLIRSSGSLLPVWHGFPFLLAGFSVSMSLITGGQATGALYAAGIVPLAAVLLGGIRVGLAWGLLTCLALTGAGVATNRGWVTPLDPIALMDPYAKFRAAVLMTFGTLGAGLIYESLHRRALRDVEEAHARADAARRRRLETEARFRALTENASDVVTEWAASGFIHYISPQIETVTGSPPEAFTHTHWLEHADRIHPDDVEGFSQALRGVVQDGGEGDASLRFRHTDGSWRWMELTIRAFRSASGARRLVSVGRDVTDRREVETLRRLTRELEETAGELARTNRELEEFTSVASHDLQEPLRKLVAFSDLLRTDLGRELPPDAERDLQFIRDGAERMRNLVQDLLALSRTGVSAMKLEPIRVETCVERALEMLALRVEETGAEIACEQLPQLMADATLVTEIFQNLIGNALKFTDGDPPRIHIAAERRGATWVIGVRDEGIGLAAEDAEEIFKPFRRLHPVGRYDGSGIGLAICRKAVERHGGRIWVESQPGSGAHFRFTLGD